MKTMTKKEWENLEEGKLKTAMTVESFKKEFRISDEEFEKAEQEGTMNEYETKDLSFYDSEGDSITAELSNDRLITHIYA